MVRALVYSSTLNYCMYCTHRPEKQNMKNEKSDGFFLGTIIFPGFFLKHASFCLLGTRAPPAPPSDPAAKKIRQQSTFTLYSSSALLLRFLPPAAGQKRKRTAYSCLEVCRSGRGLAAVVLFSQRGFVITLATN